MHGVYDLHGPWSVAHVAGCEPDDLNDVLIIIPHVSRVGSVLPQILHNMV